MKDNEREHGTINHWLEMIVKHLFFSSKLGACPASTKHCVTDPFFHPVSWYEKLWRTGMKFAMPILWNSCAASKTCRKNSSTPSSKRAISSTSLKSATASREKVSAFRLHLEYFIFVQSPSTVVEIGTTLHNSGKVVLLTGTMRGKERDDLVDNPVFQAFNKAEEPAESHFLVATSAGSRHRFNLLSAHY
jgi:hypothetical protein